jgi:hypothetical protein
MMTPFTTPSPSNKRTIEDVEHDHEEVAEVMSDMKRRQVEVDDDGSLYEIVDGIETRRLSGNAFSSAVYSEDYNDMSESDPEQWSLKRLDELFENYDQETEPTAGGWLDGQVEETNDQDMLAAAGWTYGEGNNGHGAVGAEQGTAQEPERPTIQPVSYGRRNPLKPVFPAADAPLPDDLSLLKLCEKWPNHLIGVNLRRFVQEGWKAGKIFVSMHPDARDALTKEAALSSKKGWEIIEQRLDDETEKIAEETGLAKVGQTALPQSSAPSASQPSQSAGVKKEQNPRQPKRALGDSSDNLQPGHFFEWQLPTPGPAMESVMNQTSNRETGSAVPNVQRAVKAHSSGQPQAAVPNLSAHSFKIQCWAEIDKQDRLLDLLLSGLQWIFLSPVDKHQRMHEAWVAKARQSETNIISESRVDVAGLDFQATKKGEMLIRQGELLRRIFFQTHPLSPNTGIQELEKYRQEMMANMRSRQLVAVRSWTVEWERELSVRQIIDSHAVLSIEPVFAGEEMQTSTPAMSSIGNPPLLSIPANRQYPQAKLQDMYGVTQQVSQLAGAVSYGYSGLGPGLQHGMTDTALQNKPLDLLVQNPQFQRDRTAPQIEPLASRPNANMTPQQPMMYATNTHPYPPTNLPANPFMHSSNHHPAAAPTLLYPQQASTVSPLRAPGSSGRVRNTGPKKQRGAPRKRMFPTKPMSDVPLSARAQVDDEEVLRNFPEHLSNAEVMQRFVRTGYRSGGWPTEKMVDILVKHPNAKDSADTTPDEHRANVKRWVIKERDTCNAKQRKEAEIAPRQNVTQGNPSASAPYAQAYTSFTTPVNPPVQPSYGTSYNAYPPILGPHQDMTSNMSDLAFQANWPITDPSIMNATPTTNILDPNAYLGQDLGQSSFPTGEEIEGFEGQDTVEQTFNE